MGSIKIKNKALRYNLIASLFLIIVQLLSMSIASHTLENSALGVYGIYLSILSISLFISDMGVSTALIKLGWNSKEQLAQVFTINVFIGGVTSFILFMLANEAEIFFKAEGLALYIYITAIAAFLNSISKFFIAILNYELSLMFVAKIEFFTKALASIFSLVYLLYNKSMLGFAFSQILLFSIQLLICVLFFEFKKRLRFDFKENLVRKHISFSIGRTFESSSNQLTQNIDTFLISKIFGLEILGIYIIVKQVVLKPLQIINPIFVKVYLPIICKYKLLADIREGYTALSSLLFFISILVLFSSMYFIGTGIFPLIKLNTDMEVYFYCIMCVWGALRSWSSPIGVFYIATLSNKKGIKFNFISFFIVSTFLFLIAGLNFSLVGLAIALVASQISVLIAQHCYILRYSFLEVVKLFSNEYKSIVIALISFLLPGLYYLVLKEYLNIIFLIISSLLMTYLFLFILSKKFGNNALDSILTLVRPRA